MILYYQARQNINHCSHGFKNNIKQVFMIAKMTQTILILANCTIVTGATATLIGKEVCDKIQYETRSHERNC